MRRKIDARIRILVENCVKLRQRSLFVIVGDKGREQVVNLHYMLSKTVVKARPSVLWCYKKDLYLSSHRKKRMRQIKKMMQRGLLDPEQEDPFTLFVASTNIRYCYYHDTHKILGNTFGMCVLQDFEALTPNLLARTIETVEGGGIVVLLLSTLDSLTQLYSLTMDMHSRLRTESHQQVTGRLNERLVLSLASNPVCILMDDELNILPTSSHVKAIQPLPMNPDGTPAETTASGTASTELKELTEALADTQPAGSLVAKCRTLDQARAVVTFLDSASEKTLRSTVALTAARGRGKSAALGLAISGAIALGYSNIFVTAPSPENLRTLFEFIFKGLDSMDYKEHIDYDLVESTNPAFGKAIVRVNIFRNHRQTVQYIQPQHHAKLAQAELLVIDEAAAIPLPLVKALLGPYLVFLCSTVNGYEGTGRSLSLKLIQQLRAEGAKLASGDGKDAQGNVGRTFREVQLQEPIRYAAGDKVEAWLHELLCLNAAEHVPPVPARLPHKDECNLYYIERDTLFSYHKASEVFLQRMMALYVASHYRNMPNDLLLMADAPAHHLFALLGPTDESKNQIPDMLCVVQVALEGAISKKAAMTSLAQGNLPQGDLIPWTVGQQFQDPDFPSLSGARIVRIAVHPELGRAGYGSHAVELLRRYYQGDLTGLADEVDSDQEEERRAGQPTSTSNAALQNGSRPGLQEEVLRPRTGLPPLLVNLADRRPEQLQYVGVSFGLTQSLYNFWHRNGFEPVYLRQTASDVTGEHTLIMLSALRSAQVEGTAWLDPFVGDFKVRFMALLAGAFRNFTPAMALSILDPKLDFSEAETQASVQSGAVALKADSSPLSPYDLKRLQAYSNNLVDHHMILDLMPSLARAYFCRQLPASLSKVQAAILLSVGLQQLDISAVEAALNLPSNQILALFNKAIRRLHSHLRASKEAAVGRSLPKVEPVDLKPHAQDMEQDLDEAAEAVRATMREALDPEELAQYAIASRDADFDEALASNCLPAGGIVSLKNPTGQARSEGHHNKTSANASKGGPGLYKRDGSGKQAKGGKQKGREQSSKAAKKHKVV
ncbi:hypothetical protein WJX72_012506 [[Myrmecia] bisecta]|uniref:RNA cytidine acetyltransferase n=1 Tax=[Myrmecia] bisecta TaxID=41462 RepID=A0AAW1QTB5_9CHLO